MSEYVRRLVDVDEVASTSDLARELVNQPGCDLPLVVRARRQTAGRGRGENRWWSDEGSLTFTIVIDPDSSQLLPSHESTLALATAVEIVAMLTDEAPGCSLAIRWPNDVEFGGKKLGGILPERVETPHGVRLLLGIGLNLTTCLENAPEEIRRMATSLSEMGVSTIDRERIFARLLEDFPAMLKALATGHPRLAREWSRLDALLGKPVLLKQGDTIQSGVGAGITADGGLVLDCNGTRKIFYGGQVLR